MHNYKFNLLHKVSFSKESAKRLAEYIDQKILSQIMTEIKPYVGLQLKVIRQLTAGKTKLFVDEIIEIVSIDYFIYFRFIKSRLSARINHSNPRGPIEPKMLHYYHFIDINATPNQDMRCTEESYTGLES